MDLRLLTNRREAINFIYFTQTHLWYIRCHIQYVQIYTIYMVHVNCDIDYGGQTFSYILDLNNYA